MIKEVADINILINQLDNMNEQIEIRKRIDAWFTYEPVRDRRTRIFEDAALQLLPIIGSQPPEQDSHIVAIRGLCTKWAEFILEESEIFARKK